MVCDFLFFWCFLCFCGREYEWYVVVGFVVERGEDFVGAGLFEQLLVGGVIGVE